MLTVSLGPPRNGREEPVSHRGKRWSGPRDETEPPRHCCAVVIRSSRLGESECEGQKIKTNKMGPNCRTVFFFYQMADSARREAVCD